MKKLYIGSLITLTVGLIVFIALNWGHLTEKTVVETPNKDVSKERIIVFDKKVDLDNDGKPERIVLDALKESLGNGPGEYSRLLIYETADGTEKLVFDSEKSGITDFCGVGFGKDEMIRIADDDGNGRLEIYLSEYGFASDPCRLGIIEKKGGYHVLYFGFLDDFQYKDYDNDGNLEISGVTAMGGQVRYNAPLWTAFKREGNQYVSSYTCTKILIDQLVKGAEAEFIKEPSSGSAYMATSFFVLAGDREGFKSFLLNHKDALIKCGFYSKEDLDDVNAIIESANGLFEAKKDWLDGLK